MLDREANYKYIFANPFAGPDVAILDPVLLTALSPSMIAATAMDAFSHSAEAYTCKAANVMMEPLALASMEMIVKHLPAAMKEPGNLEELEQLLIASCILGAEIQAQAAPKEIGRIVSDSLQSFNRSIGIGRLSDYGVTEEQLDSMAEYAIHEGGTQGNSFRPSPKAEVVEYLKSIL